MTRSSASPPERTGWDSNPRGRMPTRFPVVRLKPLGHPSFDTGQIGAPGFEPGTSATRTQRSTGLSHAPWRWESPAARAPVSRPATGKMSAEAEGLEPPSACARRISSAVPYQLGLRLLLPGRRESALGAHGGSGMGLRAATAAPRPPPARRRSIPVPSDRSTLTEGVGFEPTWSRGPTP